MSKSDVSSVTKYFPTINEGFQAAVASPGVALGGTTVPLSTTNGLVDGTVFIGIIEPGLPAQQVFTGDVDVTNSRITNVVWTRGTNAAHATGVTVVDWDTGTALQMMSAGFLKEHGQDGKHGALTATNITATSVTTTGNVTIGGTLNLPPTVVPNTTSVTSSASLTPTTMNFSVTALATNATVALPTGTPVNGQSVTIRIKDDGTSRTLTWNAGYVGIGVTLPTATPAGKYMYIQTIYNSQSSKWDVVSVSRQG